MSNVEESNSSIQVLERAFQIIEVLANCREKVTLAEVSSLTGIPKSTTFRILKSLQEKELVGQTPGGQYYMTYRICAIAKKVLDKTSIISIAKPYIERLSSSVHSTINLVVREGNESVYVYRENDPDSPFKMTSVVGNRRPLHTSAVGKSILAGLSDNEILSYWNSSSKPKITPYTITDFDTLFNEIKTIRTLGYAMDNQENTLGVKCIAACIPNYLGKPEYAISISCPLETLTEERIKEYVPFLLSTKSSISAAMGSST